VERIMAERFTVTVGGKTYTVTELHEFFILAQDYPEQVPEEVLVLFEELGLSWQK
jgi:hypothetical protein